MLDCKMRAGISAIKLLTALINSKNSYTTSKILVRTTIVHLFEKHLNAINSKKTLPIRLTI